MGTSSRTQERFKYGICLNDECSLCKSKTVQQIPMRKDLVCTECGKPLRETLPPRKKGLGKPALITIASAFLIAILVVALWATGTFSSKPSLMPRLTDTIPPVDTADTMAIAVEDIDSLPAITDLNEKSENETKESSGETKASNKPTQTSNPSYGTISLGYGTYTGDLKNGQPHGHGTISYTSSHKIVNSADYVAKPGDKYEGDFRDGHISGGIGYWYHDGDITAINP